MAGLIEEINSQEDAVEYARSDPDKALGIVIWNLMLVKKQCNCRLEHCRLEQKKGRTKNAILQTVGGFIGGTVAAWGIWTVEKASILSSLKDHALEYVKTYLGR